MYNRPDRSRPGGVSPGHPGALFKHEANRNGDSCHFVLGRQAGRIYSAQPDPSQLPGVRGVGLN